MCSSTTLVSLAAVVFLLGTSTNGATERRGKIGLNGYRIDHWTTTDGLPHNKVESLLQSPDGYLWVGTGQGLARFDGLRFVVISDPRATNVTLPGVPALAWDKQHGGLWAGTTAGLFHLRDYRLTWLNETQGLPHRKVWKLLCQTNGELWMKTEREPARFKDGEVTKLTTQAGLPDANFDWIAQTPEGRVWLGKGSWRRQWDPREDRFVEIPPMGLPAELWIKSMTVNRAGELLIGTDRGLYRGKDGYWSDFGMTNGLADSWVHFAFEDSSGQLWVSTKENGLYRREGDRFVPAPLGISNTEFSVDRMCEDREGNLWIGTHEGLIRLRHQPIATLTSEDGLVDNRISTVYSGPDNTVWIGSERGLSWIRPDGEVGSIRHPAPHPQCSIRGLIVDRDGKLWVGAHGLFQFEDGVFRAKGLVHREIQSIYEDQTGAIWVGTASREGVGCLRAGEYRWFNTLDGLGSNGADVFLDDRAGNLWIGNGGGLHQFRDEKITRFSSEQGLVGGGVRATLQDKEGVLWCGNNLGLLRFSSNRFFHFHASHGLPETTVNQILEDDKGYLYLSGLKGIHRASRQQLVDVAEGRRAVAAFITLDEADGMLSSQTSGGIAPAGCRTRDGRLWFPTIKGVAVLDPGLVRMNDLPPPVVIEQVKGDGEVVYGDGLSPLINSSIDFFRPAGFAAASTFTRLPPGRGRALEIRYTANSLGAPDKIRFKYRLEGYDHNWVEPDSMERVARYYKLPPRDYTFRLQACNQHGVWNEAGIAFAFCITPRFSETVWFPVSVASALVTVTGGLAAWRFRWQRRLMAMTQERALEAERGRIARDLHDDLGTALTGLALEADVVQKSIDVNSVAQAGLNRIACTSRSLAGRMREVVWAISPHCDTVESVASFFGQYAEQFLGVAGLTCRLSIPLAVSPVRLRTEVRHQLFLAFKEAVHNVVKHAQASRVEIQLEMKQTTLHIEVLDDGCGLPEVVSQLGHGLRNMSERLSNLGGELRVEVGRTGGTRVLLIMPCAGASGARKVVSG